MGVGAGREWLVVQAQRQPTTQGGLGRVRPGHQQARPHCHLRPSPISWGICLGSERVDKYLPELCQSLECEEWAPRVGTERNNNHAKGSHDPEHEPSGLSSFLSHPHSWGVPSLATAEPGTENLRGPVGPAWFPLGDPCEHPDASEARRLCVPTHGREQPSRDAVWRICGLAPHCVLCGCWHMPVCGCLLVPEASGSQTSSLASHQPSWAPGPASCGTAPSSGISNFPEVLLALFLQNLFLSWNQGVPTWSWVGPGLEGGRREREKGRRGARDRARTGRETRIRAFLPERGLAPSSRNKAVVLCPRFDSFSSAKDRGLSTRVVWASRPAPQGPARGGRI